MANFFTKQLKRLFLFISISLSLAANGQIKFFMAQTGSVASPPGSTVRKEAEAFDTYANTQPYANDDADASLYYMSVGSTTELTYGITTAAAGSHNISFRLRSPNGGSNIVVKDNSNTILATIPVPFSAAWETVTASITLANGAQTVKISRTTNNLDFNWFEVDNSLQSPTIRMAFVNTTNQYAGSPDLNGWGISLWNTLNTDGVNLTTPGGFVNTSLHTDRLVKWGWGITNVTALTGVGSGVTPGTANTGVFDDLVESLSWRMTNGNQIKFTGLNPARTYTVYALFGSVNYEPNTVSFTINSTTSPQRTTANNYGDRATYPVWSDDPAIIFIAGQVPTSGGDLVMTFNLISGTYIPLEALVIKEN